MGAQEFVSEIAMAMLEVDELIAAGLRLFGGPDVIFDQAADLVVRHHGPRIRIAELPVEDRMAVEDLRLESRVVVRLAETARMGELQADDEAVVAARCRAMCGDQRLAQLRDPGLGVVGEIELARIGAPVVPHRDRLAAPDQLATALAETLPAPKGVLARIAVGLSVPALHRIDAEAVADAHPVEFERPPER